MGRLARGDATALAELLDLFWPPLLAYTSRLLDDQDAAKDVVQGVFVRIWSERSQWRPRSLRAYLFRVARNLALDQLRRRDARERFARVQSRLSTTTPRTPAQVLEDDELADAVDRAIQELPERRREVFTLAYLQGLSYKEIADVLGIAVKTVGNQMTVALAELRAALKPWFSSTTSVGPSSPRRRTTSPSAD